MLEDLIKIANRLDDIGMIKEADVIDSMIKKISGVGSFSSNNLKTSPKDGTSKNSSMSELNGLLETLVVNFKDLEVRGEKLFPESLEKDPPRETDMSWTPKTELAFKLFSKAAEHPEAGEDWSNFAKNHGYNPSADGVLKFIKDNMNTVVEKFIRLRDTLSNLSLSKPEKI